MKTASGLNQLERESCTVIIGGVKMTMSEYNAMKKKSQDTKKKKRQEKMIQLLAPQVKKLVTNVKVLKSAAAYYDNGYRQWGVVCKEIINHPYINGPFVKYRVSAYEIADLLKDIEKIGRRNEKDIFQFIEKLSYKVDDAKEHLMNLVKGVNDSRVCEFYQNEKCINETGRRLGLSILMTKALISMNEIQNVIKELDGISRGGVDVFDYDGNTNKRYYVR